MTSLRAAAIGSLFTIAACLFIVACVPGDGGTAGVGGGSTGSGIVSGSTSGSSSSSGGPIVSLSKDVEPIFYDSCAFNECHSNASPKAGLDLSRGKARADLINKEAAGCTDGRKLVEPGNPDKSYLIDKLKGMNICFGEPMPYGDPPLSAAKMKTITDWILAGAPNN
jgi:hypothetical protein